MKILAVDDDDIVLDILEHLLSKDGHEVVTTTRGAEALLLLNEGDFQMIILDWELPDISGIEICRNIRSTNFGNYLYTIMLTSRSSGEEIVAGMSAGADDFVGKPFNGAELRMRVAAAARILSLETRDMLVFTLAKLAESRDQETGQHLERVQRFSRTLAQHLQKQSQFQEVIDKRFIKDIFLTSPLHDIGKVGIPDSILLKPGRLTEMEFEVMKTHTLLGAETLLEVAEINPHASYLKMAYDICLSHHEKYDGSGYPHGLVGEEIPLSARIVALADVYDALRSKRVYKDAFPHEEAKKLILESNGSHFDPDIVDAFLASEEEFIKTSTRFRGDASLKYHSMTSFALR